MTVRRWPLFPAAVALGLLPGCVLVGPSSPPEPPKQQPADPPPAPARSNFGVLPSRPGERIATNTAAKKPAKPAPKTTETPEAPPPPEGVVPVAAEPAQLTLAAQPPQPDSPLVAAVRAYVENRPDQAIEHLKSLDKTGQDFVLAVLPLLVRGSQLKAGGADPNELAVLVDQMHAAAARLETRAALRIDKVVFCQWVRGFGNYDPWPDNTPYRPNDVAELYVEVRNLTSEVATGSKGGDGFATRAAVALEVRDSKGKLIEQPDPADYRLRVPLARHEHNDFSRTPLRDYWRRYRVLVPQTPGVYTVGVEVRDTVSGRTAKSRPVQFTVAGP